MTPSNMYLLLILCCVVSILLLITVVSLAILLTKETRSHRATMQILLVSEKRTSQSLLNQLRSPDVSTLASLNQITQPPSGPNAKLLSEEELSEAINIEEILAAKGYSQEDLGYGLDAAGWSDPIVKRDAAGSTEFVEPS